MNFKKKYIYNIRMYVNTLLPRIGEIYNIVPIHSSPKCTSRLTLLPTWSCL